MLATTSQTLLFLLLTYSDKCLALISAASNIYKLLIPTAIAHESQLHCDMDSKQKKQSDQM